MHESRPIVVYHCSVRISFRSLDIKSRYLSEFLAVFLEGFLWFHSLTKMQISQLLVPDSFFFV